MDVLIVTPNAAPRTSARTGNYACPATANRTADILLDDVSGVAPTPIKAQLDQASRPVISRNYDGRSPEISAIGGYTENPMNRPYCANVGHAEVLKVIIVRAPDGGQLRGQITGAKTIRTVAYSSKKNREARYGEGATEIERIKEEEVKTQIVKAIAQPCRIHALLRGRDTWDIHIPDFSNLLDTGERVLIDAKRNWSDFRKPDGQRQSFLGELAAEALGYRYERIVLGSMGDQVRRDNVDEIQACRFVHVPDHLAARAASAVAKGPISLGNLADLLHPVNGRSLVYSLMVRRIVEIDLDSRLSRRSECIAVKPLPLSMPSLRR